MKAVTIDNVLKEEIPLTKKIVPRVVDIICFCVITAFCIALRTEFFGFLSRDYEIFLKPWFDELKLNGGFAAIGLSLGDYTPPYIYIMALLTYLPFDSLTSIKLVSCLFDFALAFLMMKAVFEHTQSKYKYELALACYTVTLIAPTIFLNSSAWAQCDSIFVTFLVMSMLSLTKGKPFWCVLWFSISLCFKLQAIFFAPFLLLFFLKGKIKLRYFSLIPICYFVSIIPAWIMGRQLSELLTIYFSQSGQYMDLSLNAPNLYLLLSGENQQIATVGILICAIILGFFCYALYCREFKITTEFIITSALMFSILMPFFLPHMHERYFYLADVLAILYAFIFPKRWYIAATVGISSLLCYMPYLFHVTPIPLLFAMVLMGFSLIAVVQDCKKQV